ncbi:PAS domain-containing response regulator [Pedosphaera parvula]|uniref:Putative PAS/PAC sensor protein n=1 Tax=Pedosphaera parvula (strain Ellin514) TaxID=320771 RepID=B9XEJ3_PEDPL|nr:PAS domain S-box protein [Pedosphaera parvula]EEF61707.1 putative PAS/PAC sensor protein [Pedosphaera parvula Ellin514]
MKGPLRILHLEDDPLDGELIRRMLQSAGLVRECVRVETADAFAAALEQPFDFILSDFTLPGFNGMNALEMAHSKLPDAPFIFVSGTIEEELAVESLKQGATDYVFKNRLSRLIPSVRRAMQAAGEREESRRAEEAMRQSEYKYRQLFESLSDAAFLIEPQSGRILDTNKQGEQLLGRTRGEIVGLKQDKIHIPEKFEDCRNCFRVAAEQGTTLDCEAEVIGKDGALIPVHIRAAPILLYGRNLMLALYRDITERKRAEERMHEQARLLDLDPDAIIVQDMEDRIQFWNQGATSLYQWTSEEVLGRETSRLLYHDLSEFEAAKQIVMERGEWSGELHQITRDNHEVVVFSRWKVVRNEAGQPRSILLVNTDISQHPSNRLAGDRIAADHLPLRL